MSTVLTVWLHRWTGASGLSYTCVPFKLPGGEEYKYITTYFVNYMLMKGFESANFKSMF